MTLKVIRSIVRFLLPLVGVGGMFGYLNSQANPSADGVVSKNTSFRLFQHLAADERLSDGDRPSTLDEPNSLFVDDSTQAPKQEMHDEPTAESDPGKRPPANNPPPFGSTDVLFRVTGTLESGDEVLPTDQSFYDEHAFEGRAGQPVIITLESSDFDTYLILVSPDQRLINENDDVSDANSNSSLTTILPTTGTYLAIANAFDSNGQGSYTLTVREIVGSIRGLNGIAE